MNITKISKKELVPATLNDGVYYGTWGGYSINIETSSGSYVLTTEEGIRGIGYEVVVTVHNGVATFETLNNQS